MDSIRRPLSRLVEALQWFAVNPDIRLLHVVASADLRIATLEHIAAAEHDGANHAPFFVLEAPVDADDDGWETRIAELGDDWADLQKGCASSGEGVELPDLRTTVRAQTPLTRFAAHVQAVLHSLPRPPFEGVTLVLAPVWVSDAARWITDLRVLLARAELVAARVIVVDLDEPAIEPLRRELGARAEVVDARVDAAATRDDMQQMLAAMAAAPANANGPRAFGAAGPREAPPLRKNAPPSLSDDERNRLLAEAGVPEVLGNRDVMKELRLLLLGGAQAMQEGQPAEAIRQQRRARDLCRDGGLPRQAVTMELILGGYMLQGGSPANAIDVFRAARRHAEDAKLHDLAVQAQLAMGSALLLCKRVHDAAIAFDDAGRTGSEHGQLVLAVEGYRMAGQLLASERRTELACAAWRRALEVVDGAPPDVRASSSASDAARSLAAACRKHGLVAQAVSLEAQAEELEMPVPPAGNGNAGGTESAAGITAAGGVS